MTENILELKNISKEFPGVKALSNINISIKKGEVLGLCGENGAGKSTLIKILSGLYPYGDYSGEVYLKGKLLKCKNVKEAENEGISAIYQEIELIKEMSVMENLFLGEPPEKFGFVDFHHMMSRANNTLRELDMQISPEALVKDISVANQQMVAIAKAVMHDSDVLILDEPTSALTEKEVEKLFGIIKDLKKKGITCIYISHKLDEIFELVDRVAVIRDGEHIATKDIRETDQNDLIKMMVGRELTNLFPPKTFQRRKTGDAPILQVKNFTAIRNDGIKVVDDVSFDVYKGEVLGFTGLIGAGRTELMTSIFGAFKGKRYGKVILNGKELNIKDSSHAIEEGIGYISEDRKRYGLILGRSCKDNITLPSMKNMGKLFIDSNKELTESQKYMTMMQVKANSVETIVRTLSGGNQQKVNIAKWLLTNPKVLILDEPTRGIDVAVKYEIYKIIFDLVNQGIVVIAVSSEMQEVLGISTRIIIMREGKIAGEVDGEVDQETIVRYSTGNM